MYVLKIIDVHALSCVKQVCIHLSAFELDYFFLIKLFSFVFVLFFMLKDY